MIDRQPYLPRFMAGGPGNPLGARAMYLGSTVYRIHGTNQPSTIGKFVSSGCIGMLNEDVSRPVRSRQGRHPRGRASRRSAAGVDRDRLGGADARTELPASAARADVGRSRHAADRGAAAARAGDGALGRRDWTQTSIGNGALLAERMRRFADVYASLRSGSPLNQASMPSTIWL